MARGVFRVGIDEAGYAPTLGPLVVTRVRVERPAAGPDLYERLAGVVTRDAPRRSPGDGALPIHVADSKKVHSSSKGIAALERSALPFLHMALGGQGLTDLGLATALDGREDADPSDLDWYSGPPEGLPVAADPDDVASAAKRLARAFGAAGLSGLDIRSRIVTARGLNAGIASGLNKAEFLVEVVAGLIGPLADDLAGRCDGEEDGPREAAVLVDRLGGRWDYRGLLGIAFPGAPTLERSRGARESRYSVESRGGAWRCGVSFACGAEDACMTVALASIVSKYVRELFMARLNRWFASRLAGVKATAGYPVDARRFLEDTAALREREGVADELFIRVR